ncbi:MAG TPA: serine/threonine-protein kinase [Planctomycetaceae bacterium]|jgi:serine/threonine protein kinase|nr:serine/threonine-protein kinase [Planctomycetaceae bacterium]
MQARDAECCPRCGATVLGVGTSKLARTLFLREAPTGAAQAACADEIEEQKDELIGTQLHVYRCEALLGRGAMGRVYLAHHEDLGRNCALKVLAPRVWQTDIEYGKRFVTEGRTSAALVHPNIVTTHAIGESRGYRFLEMEFVPGRSLQELIEHEQRLLPSHAMSLILRIAEGLAAAHQKGIIHRDLKPDNVLVSVQSVPKIADFGLAKRVWSERDEAELLVGTPHYMAPELFNGEPASAASDVYALGTCLFVMLTGQVPYQCGSIQALAERVQDESLPDFRKLGIDVPLEIADCLDQLMAKTPANRPKDGGEALQLLTAVAGDLPDLESMLTLAFGSQPNVTWTRCGEKFCLDVRLPEGRRQAVRIEPTAHPVADRLLLIYSQCGDVRPEYFERGLRLNAQMAHGGLAIREIDGTPQFVMIDTYPRATVDVEEIRRSVLELASQADAVEKLLSSVDRY